MTNEPNGIGLAHIERPEPARFAESDTDCMEEWEIKDGKFVRLTEFGERMRNR